MHRDACALQYVAGQCATRDDNQTACDSPQIRYPRLDTNVCTCIPNSEHVDAVAAIGTQASPGMNWPGLTCPDTTAPKNATHLHTASTRSLKTLYSKWRHHEMLNSRKRQKACGHACSHASMRPMDHVAGRGQCLESLCDTAACLMWHVPSHQASANPNHLLNHFSWEDQNRSAHQNRQHTSRKQHQHYHQTCCAVTYADICTTARSTTLTKPATQHNSSCRQLSLIPQTCCLTAPGPP
jgi:hypothetical protein